MHNKPAPKLQGLPDGWTSEQLHDHTVLHHPSTLGGYVTIDWNARGFRGGLSTSGRLISTKTYRGRGWQKAVVRDAVAWLSGIYASRPRQEV